MNKYKAKKYLRQYPELLSADPGKKSTFISDEEIPDINWFTEKKPGAFSIAFQKIQGK